MAKIQYSDKNLRILAEDYIIKHRSAFTLKGVCTYVLYCAMEDGHSTGSGLYESDQLASADCDRISSVFVKIADEGRIVTESSRPEGRNEIKGIVDAVYQAYRIANDNLFYANFIL